MKPSKKNTSTPSYHFTVRLVALILSLLVTGGVLTYLATFIINLF